MEKVRIKCPVCGVILETDDNPANYEKNVTCPNCKTKNKFSSFKRLSIASVPVKDSSTEIKAFSNDVLGVLLDPLTGQKYQLLEGRNLIGRMTYKSPPQANIPIITKNSHMSRSHLYIDVMKGVDGYYHVYASNASNLNETKINGVILENDDKLSLKHQDKLSLSGTELIYLGSVIKDETIIPSNENTS